MIRCKTKDGRIVKLHPIDYREQLALGHIAEGPDITITPPKKKEEKTHSVVVKPSTKPEDIPEIRPVEAAGDTVLAGVTSSEEATSEKNTTVKGVKEKPSPVVKKKRVIQRVGKRNKPE